MSVIKHEHLIVRAEVASPPSEKRLVEWMRRLVPEIGMKALRGPISAYVLTPGNRGATCAIIIETSHMVCHCWDEPRPSLLQLDIYSCSTLDKNVIIKNLEEFKPSKVEYKFLDREHGLTVLE